MPVQFLSPADHERLNRYPDEVTREDLNVFFQLSAEESTSAGLFRGEHNRLGFALTLCGLRFLGFFAPVNSAPKEVVTYVATQLGVEAAALKAYGGRERTVREHQAAAAQQLGFRRASPLDLIGLEQWLLQRALEHDKPKLLFELVCEYLRRLKIVRLGTMRLAQLVGAARREAETVTFTCLEPFLSAAQCRFLDSLLETTGVGQTALTWLQQTPQSNGPTAIVTTLEKIAFLQENGVAAWSLGVLNPNRVKWLSKRGASARVQGLRELKEASRYPVLLTFLKERLYLFSDDVVEMVNQRLWELYSESKRSFQSDRLAATKTINETLAALKVLGYVLLDASVDDEAVRQAAFDRLTPEKLEAALGRADTLIRPEDDAYVDYFVKHHQKVQNFSRMLLSTLTFRARGGDGGLLEGLALVTEIHDGKRRKLPVNTPTRFIPKVWLPEVTTEEGFNWRSYEIAALWVLRERLRSGDVYLPHSRRFTELEGYFIPKREWPQHRKDVLELTGTPLSAEPRLQQKRVELKERAERVERLLKVKEGDLREEGGKLILTPHAAEVSSGELDALRRLIDSRLPQRDITDVLIEVDNWTGYSDAFTHLDGVQTRGRGLLLNLYGCLLAQACNLGFKPLANAAALPYNKLLWCNRWYVREETLAEATATLVNFMQKLPYGGVWGNGLLSSSDGQRFAAKGDIRKARALPRYYGYGKGVTFYTWALDLFAQYGSKAIPSTVRDATFVLDALLDNLADLEVTEHTTDTAGYTELIFALFDLLGLRFSPRIRDLGDQQLYRTADLDLARFPKMRAQLTGIVNERRIEDDWDEMLRLTLSLKKGYVTASLIVQKLQAYPRKHSLMRSLQEYGRLVKTLHILSWYEDLALRQRVSRQLNKGEALHRLREHIFYGKHGELAGMEDEPLDHVVSCLNVVTNIVVVWNAVQMAKVVEDLKLEGVTVRDEDLARIWPTRFGHLNVIGRYHFDEAQIRDHSRPS